MVLFEVLSCFEDNFWVLVVYLNLLLWVEFFLVVLNYVRDCNDLCNLFFLLEGCLGIVKKIDGCVNLGNIFFFEEWLMFGVKEVILIIIFCICWLVIIN